MKVNDLIKELQHLSNKGHGEKIIEVEFEPVGYGDIEGVVFMDDMCVIKVVDFDYYVDYF